MIATFHGMSTFRSLVKLHGINPSDRSGHHAEVEMVDHGLGIPALGLSASDLLFEFFEPGLDLPSGPVILHDLLDREGQIRGKQGDPSGFSKDPDNAHRSLERFEHDHPIEGHDLAGSAVEVDIVWAGQIAVLGRHDGGIAEGRAVLGRTAPSLGGAVPRENRTG